jgi:hypothetical protein
VYPHLVACEGVEEDTERIYSACLHGRNIAGRLKKKRVCVIVYFLEKMFLAIHNYYFWVFIALIHP